MHGCSECSALPNLLGTAFSPVRCQISWALRFLLGAVNFLGTVFSPGCCVFHSLLPNFWEALPNFWQRRILRRDTQKVLPNDATNMHLESKSSDSSICWVAYDVDKSEDHKCQRGVNIQPLEDTWKWKEMQEVSFKVLLDLLPTCFLFYSSLLIVFSTCV